MSTNRQYRYGSRWIRTAFLAGATGGLFACAAAAPMAGPAADAAGTAVEKSGDVMKAGKVQSYQPVAIDDMIAIAHRAAGELDLRQVGQEKHPDQIKLIYQDQRHQDITVTLVRRTYKATEIHVDVGLMGNNGMGQLVMRQMLHDLAAQNRTSGQTFTSGGEVPPTAFPADGQSRSRDLSNGE